jgi:hypothetical protein
MKKWMLGFCLSIVSICVQADQAGLMGSAPVDCSALTGDEQVFAAGLNANNQMLFCQQFSQAQRNRAMLMAGQPDNTGNIISADAAVQKVASDSNITTPTAPGVPPRAPSVPSAPRAPGAPGASQGGCPVK